MSDQFTLKLNSPITEEQWDTITDVDFDHTEEIFFHTKHGKEVTFVKQKKGKWIGLDDDAVMTDTVQCSVCRKQFTVDADRFYDIGFVIEDLRFCPNCGADMRADMRGETDE